MYQKIQKEINKPYYQQYYSNDGQRFIAWYLRNIHLRDVNQSRDERAATRQYFNMLPTILGASDLSQQLNNALKMENEHFEVRWAAD